MGLTSTETSHGLFGTGVGGGGGGGGGRGGERGWDGDRGGCRYVCTNDWTGTKADEKT